MLYAVRHGETTHNPRIGDPDKPALFQNHYCATLTPHGKAQMDAVGEFFSRHYSGERVEVLSSKASRVLEAATHLLPHLDRRGIHIVDFRIDDNLLERGVGRHLDGKVIPNLPEAEIDALVIAHGGEPIANVWTRMGNFLDRMSDVKFNSFSHGIIAVTSEFPLKAMLGHFQGLSMRDAFQHLSFENASITAMMVRPGKIEIAEPHGGLSHTVNYTMHLPELPAIELLEGPWKLEMPAPAPARLAASSSG